MEERQAVPRGRHFKEKALNFLNSSALVPRMRAPKLDGIVGQDEWKGSATLVGFKQCLRGKGKPLYGETTVRVGYDETALYLAFECEENVKELIVRCTGRDTGVWDDDSVDFVILPPGVPQDGFFHFIINAKGALYDARGKGAGSAEWNGEVRIAVGRVAERNVWTLEVSIPWKDFGKKPESGEVWRAQFGRINPYGTGDVTSTEFSSWSPTATGFNNAPLYLGVLLFL